jgi:hypothetical protein
MALLANPLHQYSSFNYTWTLSAMYPGEVNRPEEYIGTQGKIKIIKSGGIGNKKTVTTQQEEDVGSNGEFFIDDVVIDTTTVPSVDSPTTNVAALTFKVFEPYSLGLFLQTMSLAARKAGFNNYVHAPYLLSLQFKGWKDDGTFEEVSQKNFVISVAAINFTTTEQGSTYEITATPWNYGALGFARQGLKSELSLKGSTVAEILSFGEQSLAVAVNKHELLSSENEFKVIGDQFQIGFPFDISPDAPAAGGPFGGALRTIQNSLNVVNNTLASISGIGNALGNLGDVVTNVGSVGFGNGLNNTDGTNNVTTPGEGINSTLTTIGSAIEGLASAISLDGLSQVSNEIGTSEMIESFNEFGTVDFADEAFTFDESGQVYNRESLSVHPTERVYTYPQGSTIEQVITSVVLLSKWGQSFVNRPVDSTGMRPWFKIKVKTYILSVAEMDTAGRPAYRFVYEVYPYFIHNATVSLPSSLNNVDRTIDDAVKAYNYQYTGLNRDVIDFDITFNSAFYLGRPADNNQATSQATSGWAGPAYATPPTPALTTPTDVDVATDFNNTIGELRSTIEQVTNLYKTAGGTYIDSDRTRAAHTFRNLILNNPADLAQVELTIWGDPYYLSSSDIGNYTSAPLAPNINADGEADVLRSQVFVLLKFNTPVDYNKDLLQGDPLDQFTGLYMITAIGNTFNQGKFVQTLALSRMSTVSPSSIDKLKNVVDSFFAGLSAISNFATQIGADDVALGVNNFIQEAGPAANSLLGIAQIGANIKDIAQGDYQTIGDKLVGLESFFEQVQQLETQYRDSIDALGRIDGNQTSPATSGRPTGRTPTAASPAVTTTTLPSPEQAALRSQAEEYGASDPGYRVDPRSELELRIGRLLGL